MRTLVIVGQKGGVGKSTIATSLAVAASERDETVCLLDLDRQGNVASWGDRRKSEVPLVATLKSSELSAGLAALRKEGFSLAVIDTAGMDDAATGMAIRNADACLVPVKSSLFDLESCIKTADRVKRLKKPFVFVLNEAEPNPKNQRNRDACDALSGIYDGERVMAETLLVRRMDHRDAITKGLGVTEFDPKGKAAAEIIRLWGEIDALMSEGLADVG